MATICETKRIGRVKATRGDSQKPRSQKIVFRRCVARLSGDRSRPAPREGSLSTAKGSVGIKIYFPSRHARFASSALDFQRRRSSSFVGVAPRHPISPVSLILRFLPLIRREPRKLLWRLAPLDDPCLETEGSANAPVSSGFGLLLRRFLTGLCWVLLCWSNLCEDSSRSFRRVSVVARLVLCFVWAARFQALRLPRWCYFAEGMVTGGGCFPFF
ncbi:unnamed protein product [Microthlaspi erraticum]|uniref:Uncharacterized protein n=1 Tax=Microthlaspi erraticum TaxID=1685480 RepID=A0A6D2JU15_9BRAS|nr:unnamed protein product [Microthlaspi erraticum]